MTPFNGWMYMYCIYCIYFLSPFFIRVRDDPPILGKFVGVSMKFANSGGYLQI